METAQRVIEMRMVEHESVKVDGNKYSGMILVDMHIYRFPVYEPLLSYLSLQWCPARNRVPARWTERWRG